MKKLITLLAICATLTACGSDDSSKVADLEQTTTTAPETTTATTTTTAVETTTTTTAETTTVTTTTEVTTTTFDTSYVPFDELVEYEGRVAGELYSAPDKNSEVLYTYEEGTTLMVCGNVNGDWYAVEIDGQVAFVEKVKIRMVLLYEFDAAETTTTTIY